MGIFMVAEASPNRNVAPARQDHAAAQHSGPIVRIITPINPFIRVFPYAWPRIFCQDLLKVAEI
jgi:hypothetical protein